ncbi:LysM peptidoglycan-binding domain-containing protein [Brevibacillus dissolubilis]|uniref:LysM peptidoglycan-binding domain-containing protein n=1 Tax=Brevibacillus dissolubilis TaxID=1844116 RepID=UPI00111610B1|nr:LysM domain-containing protein [Brevibacillus dissolubilis]
MVFNLFSLASRKTNSSTLIDQQQIDAFLKTTRVKLTEPQKKAISRVNEYATHPAVTQKLKLDKNAPLVFFFEGDGSYDKKQPSHPEGRYGAMTIVIKGGSIRFLSVHASTLPDNEKKADVATIREGVYDFVGGLYADRYATLRVRDGAPVPATYGQAKQQGVATGININIGFNRDHPNKPTSIGCLTVYQGEYLALLKAVGAVRADKKAVDKEVIPVHGVVIVDRKDRKDRKTVKKENATMTNTAVPPRPKTNASPGKASATIAAVSFSDHTVQPGESMYGIARRQGIPLSDLLIANPQVKNPKMIRPGLKLRIPHKKTADPSTNRTGQANYSKHTIKPGETMYGIARRYGVPLATLLKMNPEIKNPRALRSGHVLRIPLQQGSAPVVNNPGTSPVQNNYGMKLGSLSAKYESNGNPGTVGTLRGDRGGKSYGAYQFSSKMRSLDEFLQWLSHHHPSFYSQLISAKKADGGWYGRNFDTKWKAIGSSNPQLFLKLQHDYTKHRYYDAAAQKLKEKKGFDINKKSLALQNVLWSTAVQHNDTGAVEIFSMVNLWGSEEQIINAVYQERSRVVPAYSIKRKRGETVNKMVGREAVRLGLSGKVMKRFYRNSSDVQVGVYKRLAYQEKNDALAMLKSSARSGTGAGR